MKKIRDFSYIPVVMVLLLWSMPVSSFVLMGGALQGNDLNLTPENSVMTTLAGGATGSADGTGSTAAFRNPNGITTDGTNLYVADLDNHTIRKVVIATGAVTTLAGSPGNPGYADGTGSNARFNWPIDLTTDGANLYVADGRNSTIRKVVIATGAVTTLAGSAVDPAGSVDGVGAAARFASPSGITTDGTNLYIADTYSHTIRKLVIASQTVTTIAGAAYISGSGDGTGAAARFHTPLGITTDGTNLYMNDSGNRTIRKMVIATGSVTTLAGSAAAAAGMIDGTGAAARFDSPIGITTDGTNLYVVESNGKTIRNVVMATGEVTSPVGPPSVVFWWPTGVTTDGISLYVTDVNCIRKIHVTSADTTPPTVSGVTASSSTNSFSIPVTISASDNAGGSGVAAYLVTASSAIPAATASGWSSSNPYVYTVAANGAYTLYGWAKDDSGNVSQNQAATVTVTVDATDPTPPPSSGLMGGALQGRNLNLTPDDISMTTLAGGATGSADGTGLAATFHNLNGITTDGTNLYVADLDNNAIRKVVIATGIVTTLAGSPGNSGSADGTGSNARFNWPIDLTTDGANLYVADGRNSTIRKVVIATGVVTTLAGSAVDPAGSVDGVGPAARFASPCGITTDGTNLYIADTYSHTIRKIVIATRAVTTLAGLPYSAGSINGIGAAARFDTPRSITTDGANLYVNDLGNRIIRKIVIATGEVTTLAGSAGAAPDMIDGTGTAAKFYNPAGITTDGMNLYVVESDKKTIRKIVMATRVVTTLVDSAVVLWWPIGVTTDGTNLYVTDVNCIRTIDSASAPTPPPTPPPTGSDGGGGGGGCFIATAAYGSYLDPHVQVLRYFRDHYLMTHRAGKALVDYYYSVSPPIADYIKQHEPLKKMTRFILTPIVYGLEYPWFVLIFGGIVIGMGILKRGKRFSIHVE